MNKNPYQAPQATNRAPAKKSEALLWTIFIAGLAPAFLLGVFAIAFGIWQGIASASVN